MPGDLLRTAITAVPPELISVAAAFVDLQEYRHRADYDTAPASDFDLNEVKTIIGVARAAFANWRAVEQAEPEAAEVYLLTMLLDMPRRD